MNKQKPIATDISQWNNYIKLFISVLDVDKNFQPKI